MMACVEVRGGAVHLFLAVAQLGVIQAIGKLHSLVLRGFWSQPLFEGGQLRGMPVTDLLVKLLDVVLHGHSNREVLWQYMLHHVEHSLHAIMHVRCT
jgi:hypothetical protein